ncbi:MAG: PadR family transcriptional regulator [Rhodospirillales bacterium]|nr:MAG: PadR family transcriptional regulator [Rhodospirillales bacterium]
MDSKTLCLGVLMLGDATGYEIKKHFEEGPFAHFHAAGFGSIYPALNALLAGGLVTCTELSQQGRPDKKVYSITEQGRSAFRRALHKPPAEDTFRSEAIFMMFFAELLDRDHLSNVFEGHLSHYRQCVERMAGQDMSGAGSGRQFVHGMGLAIYRAVVGYMERHRGMVLAEADLTRHSSDPAGDPAGDPAATKRQPAESGS